MRTLLICHPDCQLTREGMARWLHSFSDLAGIIVLDEGRERTWQRIRRELGRIGPFRFLDVLAFRLYYRAFLAARDRGWEAARLRQLRAAYPVAPDSVPVLRTRGPNTPEAARFIREHRPDIMVARSKTLLKKKIFDLPRTGTFVMHPGICPEYRNSHGCFWALANDDRSRVGMTLLRIDSGVDTGPVYGYFGCTPDEVNESHVVIQHRTVYDNLDAIRDRLCAIHAGGVTPIDTSGRASAVWGQPWLSRHLRWKRRARAAA